MRRSLVILSTSFSSLCSIGCAEARGRSTLTPLWISGAVTMKMMSSTSITSTSGVTLMSAIARRAPPPPSTLKAMQSPGHAAAFLKTWRLMMFKKSAPKLRISFSSTRMRELKAL